MIGWALLEYSDGVLLCPVLAFYWSVALGKHHVDISHPQRMERVTLSFSEHDKVRDIQLNIDVYSALRSAYERA